MIGVQRIDFAMIGLYYRHRDVLRIDRSLELGYFFTVAPFQQCQPVLRTSKLRQLAVDFRRTAIKMIDADRRRYFSSCSIGVLRLGSVIIKSGFAATMASISMSAVPIYVMFELSKSTPVSCTPERKNGCHPGAFGHDWPPEARPVRSAE